MNRKTKIMLLVISIFLCGIINAKAESYTCSTSGWTYAGKTDAGKPACCPSGYTLDGYEQECYAENNGRSCPGGISYKDILGTHQSHCYTSAQKATVASSKTFSMTFHKNDTSKTPATWTSNGSGRPDGSNVVASCNTTGTSCTIKSGPTITRNHYSFRGWSTSSNCSSLATALRFPVSISSNRSLYACWQEISGCYVCGNSQGGGKYIYGTLASAGSCNYYSNEGKTACESHNSAPVEQQKPGDFIIKSDPATGTGGSGTGGSGTPETANLITYYKITYDLDGGHYIDGSTTRTQIIRGDKPVGDFNTNPIKDGNVFVEWQYNGAKFDSSKKLDDVASSLQTDSDGFKNLTFKAIYAEYGDADLVYCEDEKAALDLTTKKCYTTLKENASEQTFTHTTYRYDAGTRWCYAYNAGTSDGGLHLLSGTTGHAEGKNNKEDGVYAGYSGDAWVSKNTCLIASPCQHDSSWRDTTGCELRWDAILYKAVDAKTKDKTYEKDTSFDDNSRKSDNEAGEMGPTGDALIYIIFALGLGSLGYTVYYFQKKKKNAEI